MLAALSDSVIELGKKVLALPWTTVALAVVAVPALWALQAGVRRLVRRGPKPLKYRKLGTPLPTGERQNSKEGHCLMFIGRLGSGKTSLAVCRAVKLARRQRIPLYSNAAIREDSTLLRSWDDLRKIPTCVDLGVECVNGCHEKEDSDGCCPAVIVLDELHLWYPSNTTLMPIVQQQEAFDLLSFARKRGWTVLATTQAMTRVNTGYRQLLTELYRVQPIVEGYWHRAQMIDPDTGKVLLGLAAMFSPARARYNTRAEVRALWRKDTGSRRRGGRALPTAAAVDALEADLGTVTPS